MDEIIKSTVQFLGSKLRQSIFFWDMRQTENIVLRTPYV